MNFLSIAFHLRLPKRMVIKVLFTLSINANVIAESIQVIVILLKTTETNEVAPELGCL